MGGIIGFIVGVLVAILGLFGIAGWESYDDGGGQTCVTSDTGLERCGPELTSDALYQLPATGDVIHALVNTGPEPLVLLCCCSPAYSDACW